MKLQLGVKRQHMLLKVLTDADHGGCIDTGRSTSSGFCYLTNDADPSVTVPRTLSGRVVLTVGTDCAGGGGAGAATPASEASSTPSSLVVVAAVRLYDALGNAAMRLAHAMLLPLYFRT